MSTADQAQKVTTDIFKLLNIDVKQMEVIGQEDGFDLNIDVSEEDSGIIIGYHGETLSSLQYLIGQIVNSSKGGSPSGGKNTTWQRIAVNINDYRAQRELQLKQMADTAADRALSTGDEIEMPYLTAAERRIIHLQLSDRTDITTYSEGEGRHRRLIIAPNQHQS